MLIGSLLPPLKDDCVRAPEFVRDGRAGIGTPSGLNWPV